MYINNTGTTFNSFLSASVFSVANTAQSTATAGHQLVGSTNVQRNININPPVLTISTDRSFARMIFANSNAITEASSGTHPLVSQLAIKPISYTNGDGATTNAATLYIEGAATGTASPDNNYVVWIDDGEVRIDGDIGDTTNRVTKGWFTDLTVTNTIAGSITGNADTVTNGIYTTSIDTLAKLNALMGETIASTTWAGASSILTVGVLDSGSITSGFGSIDSGTSLSVASSSPAEELTITGQMWIDGADNATSTIQGNIEFTNDARSHGWYVEIGSATTSWITF